MLLQIDWWILAFLAGAVVADIICREMAFRRVESVAIDAALFSWLYSCLKLLETVDSVWKTRAACGFIVLGSLVILHSILRQHLSDRLEEVFHDLSKNIAQPDRKDLLSAVQAIAVWAIDVALWKTKWGKKRRRETLLTALQQANLDPSGILEEDSLLLPLTLRYGMIAILIPAVTLNL
jgi:hypothetical protein